MGIGDFAPSSFDSYEGIRILIPGATFVTVYAAIVATYAPSLSSPASNFVAAFVAALLIGLALLFMDLPAKAAAYQSPDLPSRELRRWNINTRPYKGDVNLYMVMLDVSFPPMIRNRALYTGAMFRIGFEGIYAVGLASIGVLLTTAASTHAGPTRVATTMTRSVLLAVAGAHLLAILGTTRAWYGYRLRREKSAKKAWRAVRDDIQADIGVLGLVTLIVSGVGVVYALTAISGMNRAGFVVAAAALPTIAWAILFFSGRIQPLNEEQPRRPVSPPAAVILYGLACAIASAEAAARIHGHAALDTPWALGWGAASLIPSLLISSRGYERKLIGSFRTQTSWMRINRSDLMMAHNLETSS